MMLVLTIALATFREAVRARVFVYLLVVAAFVVVGAIPTADLGTGQELRLVTDLSMGGVAFTAAFLAIFLGVSAVSGEVERRTIYTVITKAASRTQFVIGKWLGVWMTVLVAIVISYVLVIAVVSGLGHEFASNLFAPLWMLAWETALLIALATFFSCITRPLLSSGLTIALYVVGGSLSSLDYWAGQSAAPEWLKKITAGLFYVLPDFEIFDIKTEVIYKLEYPLAQLGAAGLYGIVYSAGLLALGTFIFQRRDLK